MKKERPLDVKRPKREHEKVQTSHQSRHASNQTGLQLRFKHCNAHVLAFFRNNKSDIKSDTRITLPWDSILAFVKSLKPLFQKMWAKWRWLVYGEFQFYQLFDSWTKIWTHWKKLVPNFILVSKTINGHSVELGHHLLRKRLFQCLSDLHFLHCRERDNHQKGAGTWKKAEWYNKMQFDELQWPYLLHSYIFFNR